MEEVTQTPVLLPVPSSMRIKELDIIRGIAIFGILFINVLFFCNMPNNFLMLNTIWTGVTDQISYFGMRFLFEGKFYSMFSFLFGLGLTIQMNRSIEKGTRFSAFFTRRMLVLLVIGVGHAILLFYGDILSIYAVLGLIVLFIFRNRSTKTIIISAVIFLVIPLGLVAVTGSMAEKRMEQMQNNPKVREMQIEQRKERMLERKNMAETYANGSYLNSVSNNAKGYKQMLPMYLISPSGYMIISMFLLGFYAGKKKLHEKIDDILPKLKKWYPILFIVGVIGNGLYLWSIVFWGSPQNLLTVMVVSTLGYIIGVPTLCFFYLISILLLLRNKTFGKLFSAFRAVGKMALTSYIMQSLLFGLIFYGYGLGLFTQVSPTYCILLVLAVFTIILIFCNIWQKYFLFGPFEWVWRLLSYLKKQPFLK